ncbi:MAG: bifunctional proline dehydrogenase/L-glutamate gamma-semialdehyde dehydrogenase PutA [Burkholderiales bacterium]|nr:bifunctional proline dehydrogenase/L-glutamate gamma-semialdehyde dehydrogenase PutA [Burkholderiales bacterium]
MRALDISNTDTVRAALRSHYLADEASCVVSLLPEARLDEATAQRVRERAISLITAARRTPVRGGIDAFLQEYDLGTREGIALMCLAEALLRIPDAATADRLIRGLILEGEWDKHRGRSPSFLVNASTWGLMLGGRMMRVLSADEGSALIRNLAGRIGETTLRAALRAAMKILGADFVLGETMESALQRAAQSPEYCHSFDMLGEAALTAADAERYFGSYSQAIHALARSANDEAHQGFTAPGVSIKLSALHPRYEYTQRERVLAELVPRLLQLARAAKNRGVLVTLDAEEADRLELSLDVFAAVFADPELRGWNGFGLAVQAYQKRAPYVIDLLAALANQHGKQISLRLVKGAYWDTEIKRAQVQGLPGYPVFTRKVHTDLSYLACGSRVLAHGDAFYPQFATHNAHTIAYFLERAHGREFEFQRLHGMGEALYAEVMRCENVACRVYAPVGSFNTLLPYLVRRLLENGANTSFVNRIADTRLPPENVVADPFAALGHNETPTITPHPRIPLPPDLYGDARRNSLGLNLSNPDVFAALRADIAAASQQMWRAAPLVNGERLREDEHPAFAPADRDRKIGVIVQANAQMVDSAMQCAAAAAPAWDATPAPTRAQILERASDLFEAHRAEFVALIVHEGGRIIPDALAEVREAVDYCRYYAAEAKRLFAEPQELPGQTGEQNSLSLHGRGVFVCLSPWNFPLAIFTGQMTAALAAGNAVIAKPAEQTALIAMRAVELLLEAGVPPAVLQLLPGSGEEVGARIVADPRIAGVAFTGSTETARAINRSLASRDGAIVPLIAETGGMNAIIADSSALLEQLIFDVMQSAYNSAGQRCSAARLLFLQDDVADAAIDMLKGAMAELSIGDPAKLSIDVGPIIDEPARDALEEYCRSLAPQRIAVASLPKGLHRGCFFAPRAYTISWHQIPEREVFGPVLHVLRWQADQLDLVIDRINATGYGLTLGVHSRIEETIARVRTRARVGNLYVNRNIIGATVGVQPFGGQGLSGTGPKAGGPHYSARFAVERTVSVNTAALGGNASLLALDDG